MDVDEDDVGEGPSTNGARSVVSPGETITSAREYMRCGLSIQDFGSSQSDFQWPRDLCRGRSGRLVGIGYDTTGQQAHLGQADQVEVGERE
jgi:hypothetical protein